MNITCVAVGSPMPYVKWMLGAEDLTPEDDMPIGRNVLELTDVRQSNNYTCVAMSTLGVIEAVAQIIVKGALRSTQGRFDPCGRCSSQAPSAPSGSSAEGSWDPCGDGENSNKHHAHLGFWEPRTCVLLHHTGVSWMTADLVLGVFACVDVPFHSPEEDGTDVIWFLASGQGVR